MTSFRVHALPFELFEPLFGMSEEQLHQHRALRKIVVAKPGTPCRVTLQDAEIGETVMLTHYVHQSADTPFHASHAIYVRENAIQAVPQPGEVPPMLRTRLLSLRAFSANGMMISADVVPGAQVETLVETMFATPDTASIHIDNARQGCYLARAERA